MAFLMGRKTVLGFVCGLLLACASQPQQTTLYQRMGGEAGVRTIVDNFLYEVGDSALLRPLFNDIDLPRFRTKLAEQLCEISGGPCRYSGDNMTEVHAGMAMNNRHFDATVTALTRAMEAAGVDVASQNAMLKKLAAMHGDVMRETIAPE
ncbi:group I truncated hemoglobin [Simiduia aestuariiviva]|uniref:Hemoglobin n=1 Tax=Simiduia aestuariiviva TaxID=1510459 RepID=A0A839UQ55_9GAMM|nr:group 1 truncated hemoglobin [Simiduia aestuariiviva]MBB3169982.1 hemoglobin [Simiduia aestuariiviva]